MPSHAHALHDTHGLLRLPARRNGLFCGQISTTYYYSVLTSGQVPSSANVTDFFSICRAFSLLPRNNICAGKLGKKLLWILKARRWAKILSSHMTMKQLNNCNAEGACRINLHVTENVNLHRCLPFIDLLSMPIWPNRYLVTHNVETSQNPSSKTCIPSSTTLI